MCGIFGAICQGAVSNTLKALKLLEYRGYDSAGFAANRGDVIEICKTEGRIAALERLAQGVAETDVAIGHTRWATHGAVCAQNAHPFLSPDGRFAIVHNGIIENYLDLKKYLGKKVFSSQTDSETVAYLLEKEYRGDVLQAVLRVAQMLQGSFAIAITAVNERKLYAIKNKSPLVVGFGEGAYLCSDIRCISRWANSVAVTPDGTVAEISPDGARFFRFDGSPVAVNFFTPEQGENVAETSGDFMLKEIYEIPRKLVLAKNGYFDSGGLNLPERRAGSFRKIYFIGCGTAYNSGLQVSAVARQWFGIDVTPVIASEFVYGNYPVDGHTLAFFISQSGETADTVRAVERVRAAGGYAYAVTNTASSSLTFACDRTVNICAGGEYAVASTKAYNCQLVTLTLLMLDVALGRGAISRQSYRYFLREMDSLPQAVMRALKSDDEITRLAEKIKDVSALFYIGRIADYPTACEGSLKLKEISYIHSEAYPAGELKHGALALMDSDVAVVAISTFDALSDKTASSVNEIAARGAMVITVSDRVFENSLPLIIPKVHPALAGIASVVPLQLLAYRTAKSLGRDVDKPRNLAKSVTVE